MGRHKLKLILSAVLACACSSLTAQGLTVEDYDKRAKVTFSGYDKGQALTNFPALVVLSTNIDGFSYADFASPSGGDLRITDASKSSEINFEIEEWNTNGDSYVWVQVPTLSTTGDCIWVYWGNTNDTTLPTYTSDGSTWSQDYLGVWHLHDTNGVSTFPDSAGGDHHGTNTGTVNVDGQIGNAQDWEGIDRIVLPPASVSNLSTEVTFSFWQYGDVALQPQYDFIFSGRGSAADIFYVILPYSNGTIFWSCFGDTTTQAASPSEYEGQWNHWVFTKNTATGLLRIYLNGVLWKSLGGQTTAYVPVDDFQLGARVALNNYDGMIDEFRVANVARGSNWLWASHQTEGSNSSFQSYAAAEVPGVVQEVSFTTAASSGPESLTNVSLTVLLNVLPTNVVTVQYAVSGGSATGAGTDYSLNSGTLTFNVGEATQTIDFVVVDDLIEEPAETIEVTLDSPTNASMGLITVHTYSIEENDAPVLLPDDFNASMKVTFSGYDRGETLANFPALLILSTNLDGFSYADFQSVTGGDLRITDSSGTNEIRFEIEEWNTNGESYVWIQVPSLSTTGDCIWAYWGNTNTALPAYTSDGSTWSEDYLGVWHLHDTNGVNTFPDSAGESHHGTNTGTVNVDGQIGDAQDWEGFDRINLPPNAFSNISTEVTISVWQYGDPVIQPQWDNLFYGRSPATIELTAILPYTDSNVYWHAFGEFDQLIVPATSNQFMNEWNHWVFTKDSVSQVMEIYVNGERLATASGKFRTYTPVTVFTLGSRWDGQLAYDGYIDEFRVANVVRGSNWLWASHQTEGSNSSFQVYGQVELASDPPRASFDANASSGPESQTNFILAVVLNKLPTNAVTVQYAATGGSATGGGVDYTLNSGMLTFNASEATQWIDVVIVHDTLTESNENIEVTLSDPTNATIGSIATHTYTIEGSPEVAFATSSSSGSESQTNAELTVVLSSLPTRTVTVQYAVSGGSATGSDYTLNSGTLIFDINQATQTIHLAVVDDDDPELAETIEVTLSTPTNAWLASPSIHTYTIDASDTIGGASYKMKVTFSGYTKPSALTNFPALLVLSTNLDGFAYRQFVSQGGSDLRVTDATQTNEINFEIEEWNTNGDSFVWVQVPTLEDTNDCLWLHWGNLFTTNLPDYASDGSTWSQDYLGVWHLHDTNGISTFPDSTAGAHHGTNIGTANVIGKIGDAQDWAGGSDRIILPSAAVSNLSTEVTFSLWQYGRPAYQPQYDMIFSGQSLGSDVFYVMLPHSDTKVYWYGFNDWTSRTASPNEYEGEWNHWVFTKNTVTGLLTIYLNGVSWKASGSQTDPYVLVDDFQLGARAGAQNYAGFIDEFRVAKVARSADWIWASHQTEGSNSSFQTYASVEGLPEVSFTSAASSGPESMTNVSLSVVLSALSVDTVTVQYAVSGGSATGGGTDYTLNSGVLTFDANVGTQTIDFLVTDDATLEIAETMVIALGNPTNAQPGAIVTHTYTIEASDVEVDAVAFSVNGGEDVTEAQMASGNFSVEMTFYDSDGVESTNTLGPYFIPHFDILDPLGAVIVTDHVFSSLSHEGSDTLVASNTSHAGYAEAVTGVYTMRWSAVDSNGLSTIDYPALSNGTLVTFTVADDDVMAPIIDNFTVRGYAWPTLGQISTVTVASLLSGEGWNAFGQVKDVDSGINVNGSATTQPSNSPYLILIDPFGVEKLTNVFNLSFIDGGATTWRTFSNSPPAAMASATTGVWIARVIITDNDEDRPGDQIVSTNDFTFDVVDPANSAPGVGLSDDIPAVWLPNTAALFGSIVDDNQPIPPGVATGQWTMVSGPGVVTFGDESSPETTASFSTNGEYVLRLTAYDTELSNFRQATVTVNAVTGPSQDPNITWGRVLEGGSSGRQLSSAYSGGIQAANPTFVDFDGDGDLDLFSGEWFGSIVHYENIGTAHNPQWEEPAWGFAEVAHNLISSPEFADTDNDGDLDLYVGATYGIIFLENTGSVANAAWAPQIWIVGQFGGAAIHARPAFADIDNDGDLDLFYGETFGEIKFVENTGSVSEAAWAPVVDGYAGVDVGLYSAPAFGDMDGDGDLDLITGENEATLFYVENTGTASVAGWAPVVADYAGVDLGQWTLPTLGDIDGDGDLDLVVGDLEVQQVLYENLGTATNAVWNTPVFDYIQIDMGLQARPAFVDIDDDGDYDMFGGGDGGSIIFFENEGSPTVPLWKSPVIDVGDIDIGNHQDSSPTLGDLDGDGDEDMLIGESDGTLNYAENFGTNTQYAFSNSIPNYAGIDVGSGAAPTLVDIDNDGDLDLLIGDFQGKLHFFENTGSVSVAAWAPEVFPYAQIDVGQLCVPSFEDMDGDHDFDMVLGTKDGTLHYHENTGSLANAAWAAPITNFGGITVVAPGSQHPNGQSTPIILDIDDDGDTDLFAGETGGGLNFFRNQNAKLRVVPPNRTMKAGKSHQFRIAPPQDAAWSFVENNSDGTINATNGYYTSGTNAPALDVIQAVDTNTGAFGRAHINVIDPANAGAIGKAIVIAGAKSSDDPVWNATDEVADKAYLTLLRRGFAKTNIYYLSFDPNQDVDGDGLTNDIDGVSSLANASYAFNTFAQNSDKLFVFVADHGSDSAGEGYMRLSPGEQLSATQLNSWVSSLQNSETNMEVTIAMDFCYSGSFLDELVYTGSATRVNIASTDTNELTYFIAGGLVSFSDAFLTALQIGYDFNNAFIVGQAAMSTYQRALIDDNKDGVYSKGIDGANATNRLGATFVAGQDIPQIGSITPNQTITTGTTVTLVADTISSVFPIERVWCAVVPPSHNPDTDAGVPVLDIPEFDLIYNAGLDRYEADFDGFTEQGVYKVIFLAKDIWNSVSVPKQSYINQGNFDERTIIVAGGPDSDPNWSNITFIAQSTYNVLQARLFDHSTIYYISADTNIDIDADGTNDVDATPSLSSISNAIANWASAGDRLNVFLIGNGTNNELQVTGSEILDAGSFDAWLDDYQASARAVNIVMDFDGSGGFATNLVPPSGGKERINIASTRPNRRSIMDEGGLVSFSQYFLTEIFGGKTIGDATTKARKAIRRASGRVRQRAGIDDDGDGLLNEKNVDGIVARQRYIGAAFATGDDSPNIAEVIPVTALTNTSSLTIWASDVTDVDGISNVWCVITPPDYDGESELPREDLAYDAGDDRYEVLYSDFTKPGGYTLTFYASDNEGEVSPAAQSTVVRKDEFEDDDTFQQATTSNGDIFQIHTFHDSADEDWLRFFALSNYVYDIETFHFTTNIDTIVDVYYREQDGSMTSIDHVDDFGFDEGELTGLNFPEDGFYYVQVSQYITNGSLPGMYEIVVTIPAGDGIYLIFGIDELNSAPLPMGSYALVNGQSNAFNGEYVIPLVLAGGDYTVQVVPSDLGYLPSENPASANQVANPSDAAYGNPRADDIEQVEAGEAAGGLVFGFFPHVTVQASVRDKATHERLMGVAPMLETDEGFYSTTNGYSFDGYPFYTSYKSNWATDVEGDFPISMLVPATNSDLMLSCPGYSNYLMDSALSSVSPGQVIDLGMLELSPMDTNGNGIADSWENLHFPGTNVNIGQDSDGDGHTDDEEYLLGTDPNSATNVMAADEMMMTNGFTLVWPVENGRSYQIGCTTNLMNTNWTVVAGPWEATAMQTEMQWTDTNSVSFTGRCYRVEMTRP